MKMGKNIIEKILISHLVKGEIKTGQVIKIKIDQVLTQDATGTMAYLQFEAIGKSKIMTDLAVSYVDHNTLQTNFKNQDDHLYLQTTAAKYGAYFSKPGNGICHQVNLERFAVPGQTLLGSDSHTPTAGGMGTLAIGVGGLDIASVMAGEDFELTVPEIVLIKLEGSIKRPWVTAMDIILDILGRQTVSGGVGKIFEYGGSGVDSLSLSERATITNMGAELGATTSIFPSDQTTRRYLKAQEREEKFYELKADTDAKYSDIIEIDLSKIEPLISQPHSPDNVIPIREISGLPVDQVCIGSCTNSSFQMLKAVADMLKGRSVHPNCSLVLNPGSRQVYEMLAKEGCLKDIISAGARLLEASCGPCIGMGQTPGTETVSVRTYNRNFKGRSGNITAKIYLCSPLSAVAMAIKGEIIDPRDTMIDLEIIEEPAHFIVNDNMIIPPAEKPEQVEVIRGPNIKAVPLKNPLKEIIESEVLIKLGDNITTDDILPGGTKILPLRSNIPAISRYVFHQIDENFIKRAEGSNGGWIIGGNNYGQGSSREHAAIALMYLGLDGIIAKSYARIHRQNLINFGLIPLRFENEEEYDKLDQGDKLIISGLKSGISKIKVFTIYIENKKIEIQARLDINQREEELLLAGGLLPFIKRKQSNL